MKSEILFENPWISLKKIGNYVYSHESRCNGEIISILPFRRIEKGFWAEKGIELLLRSEITPSWSATQHILSTITGGKDERFAKLDAVRELKEEAGYDVRYQEIIDLGVCHGSKSSDTIYHLFSVDLTGKEQGELTGDGSECEKSGDVVWVNKNELSDCVDPLASVAYLRLTTLL